jgi:hypothetical protein
MTICFSNSHADDRMTTCLSNSQDDDRTTMCLSKYHRTSRFKDVCMRAVLKSVHASRVKARASRVKDAWVRAVLVDISG